MAELNRRQESDLARPTVGFVADAMCDRRAESPPAIARLVSRSGLHPSSPERTPFTDRMPLTKSQGSAPLGASNSRFLPETPPTS